MVYNALEANTMSIVINNKKYEVDGLKTESWLDGNPKVKYVTDKDDRKRRIRLVVLHTHEGIKGDLLDGFGPNTTIDERLSMYQVSTDRYVSWDGTVDQNGDVTWQNDPIKHYTWQAGDSRINQISLGIELVQKIVEENGVKKGNLYKGQLEKTVLMIDFLTATLGIQRQIPWDKARNKPALTQLARLQKDGGGNVVGIVGHVQLTSNRGVGDPGPYVFEALRDAGYELFDISSGEDLTTWKQRQLSLGMSQREADGIPLDDTIALLKAKGHKHGLWVKRPIDDLLTEK